MQYKTLFKPMNIGKVEIKNRIVVPPMCMGFGQFDGRANEVLLDYYEERAKGGAGLIISEITRVNDKHGAGAFQQLAASHDYHIESLKELATRVHKHGAKLFVQLHHPGRQNYGLLINTLPISIKLDKIFKSFKRIFFKSAPMFKKLNDKKMMFAVVAPSKVEPSYVTGGRVRALRQSEIRKLVRQFVNAAIRVKKAGCDGVELHGAHGYLIQQFLSPHTNKRTDRYGGTFEKRMRFLQEIIQGIRLACGSDFPIIVRISADECYDKIGRPGIGYGLDEGINIAKYLETLGIDAIDVSCGAYDTFNTWLEPVSWPLGWRKYMAASIKKVVKIPVLAANLIRSAEQAEEHLSSGIQDFVSLGRTHIADPEWANKVKSGNEKSIKRCISCLYCFETMINNAFDGTHGCCSVNPFIGKEKYLNNLKRNGNGKKVMVVGGGPSGLVSASILLQRGFDVFLYEKTSSLGGQVNIAATPEGKKNLSWIYKDLEYELKQLGCKIFLNTEVTKEMVLKDPPYALVVATGAVPRKPTSIPGINGKNVYLATDIIKKDNILINKKVVLIGSGMTGLETAEVLVKNQNDLTIVEMAPSLAENTWFQHVDDVLPKLKDANVNFVFNNKLIKIEEKGVIVESTKGAKKETKIEADAVVLSMGVISVNNLFHELNELIKYIYLVGDAKTPGSIGSATNSVYEVAINKID